MADEQGRPVVPEQPLANPETAPPVKRSLTWLKETLAADREMFEFVRARPGLFKYIYFPDFMVVALFRIAHYCNGHKPLRPFAYFLTMVNDYVFGVYLPPGIQIGPGFSLAHPRGTMIHGTAKIGSGVAVLQQCIMGGPNIVIGDRVSISACAKIFSNVRGAGTLHIGDDAIVGAGSVVVRDVPARTIAAGVPATVVKEIPFEDNWINYQARRYGRPIPSCVPMPEGYEAPTAP